MTGDPLLNSIAVYCISWILIDIWPQWKLKEGDCLRGREFTRWQRTNWEVNQFETRKLLLKLKVEKDDYINQRPKVYGTDTSRILRVLYIP